MFGEIKSFKWRFLPVVFLFLFLPLVVRLVSFTLDEDAMLIYNTTHLKDWFFYYKSIVFILLTIWMLVCLIILRKKITLHRDLWFNIYYVLGGIFILTSLLSAFYSDYKTCALIGAPTRFEGIGVIVCYILVMFYTFFIFEDLKDFSYVFYSLGGLIIIQAILGFSQFIGYDLHHFIGIRDFISPGEYTSYASHATTTPLFLRNSWGSWTGSLGNKNYSGSFVALTLPLFTLLTCFVRQKKHFIFSFVVMLCGIFITFACQSQGGQVALFVVSVCCFILFARAYKQLLAFLRSQWRTAPLKSSALTLFLVGYIVVVIVFTGAHKEILHMFYSFEQTTTLKDTRLLDYQLSQNTIAFVTATDTLTLKATPDGLSFHDQHHQPVAFTSSYLEEKDATVYVLDSPAFPYFVFEALENEDYTFIFFSTGSSFEKLNGRCAFEMDSLGHVKLVHPHALTYLTIVDPPTFGFDGYERIGSGRGYIWSRSLPLLLEHFFLGSGPDTYIFRFPQDDYWGKWHYMSSPLIVVDKPHNTYLQLWINQGFIAFIAFIGINAIYLIHCLYLYGFKQTYTLQEGIGISLMLGILGYLVAGFFNDTTLSVTPLYYALLGCGMAYNRLYPGIKAGSQVTSL